MPLSCTCILLQAGPEKDTYTVLQGATAGAQPPTTSEGIMAEAGAGSGGSVAAAAAAHNQDLGAEDQMLTNQMSGLSMGAAAAAAAGAAKARRLANASVYGAAMRAGKKQAFVGVHKLDTCHATLTMLTIPLGGLSHSTISMVLTGGDQGQHVQQRTAYAMLRCCHATPSHKTK